MSVLTRLTPRADEISNPSRQARRRNSRVRLHLEALEERWVPATYSVTSAADSGGGTLREAIGLSNTSAGVLDTIAFNLPAGGSTVALLSALPDVTDPANIDGTTQPGYAETPLITIDGTLAGIGASGLTISGGSSTVQGLSIVSFAGHGIRLDGNGGNTILGNYIGITATGMGAGNGANGIFINGVPDNTIGGTGAANANVISANGGDGVLIDGVAAADNQIVANFIGTDPTGTSDLGNVGNGIRITNGARLNTIGGDTPTTNPFTGKPVEGNVISGNGANGVLLTTSAEFNTLSGNFIGTNLAGTGALGNTLDGVAILNGANNNALIGTTISQLPFVYLNVLSGNGGNGLRIHDSNDTTVQANSFGLGDDNITPVPNQLNGVLIEGSSANTQFGGVIPLGNIVAGNGGNGVEIRDTASGTVCFNTFCGLPAFTDSTVGNALDGFLITSTGGNNLLRTNVIAGNFGNGIHISGSATGVQVEENIIGLNTNGQLALPNGANGVLIDATAHDNVIGGFQVSVITQNTISANGANGIAIIGNAANNQVFHSFIGTNILGVLAFGNAGAGVFVGGSAQGTIIGGTRPFDQNVISSNLGGGIVLGGTSQGTQVIGNLIGTDRIGLNALPNQGSGISIAGSNNLIGGTAAGTGNVIAFNTQTGVGVASGTGNGILGNSIFSNVALGIDLTGGSNLQQPAPVLTAANRLADATVQITGALTAAANATYRVEFFASSSATPGQGRTSLGSQSVTTDSTGVGRYVFRSALPASAGTSITATATDPVNNTSEFSAPINALVPTFAVGAGAGTFPQVNVYNGDGSLRNSFLAFDPGFRGGVTVASSDINGDGVADVIVGAGSAVAVYSGANGALLTAFFAFPPGSTSRVSVASGDVNGDGRADIIVGTGAGSLPVVAVYSGANGALLTAFFAFDPGFLGGVSVASGDINGDGRADIIVGAGAGALPVVAVYSGTNGALLTAFLAFPPGLLGGVSVASGDVNGDGRADIIAGAGAGGAPIVAVYSGIDLSLQSAFFAFPPDFRGGVSVASGDRNGDGRTDVTVGAGPGGAPIVATYSGADLSLLSAFFAFDPRFIGGVSVG